MNIEAERTIARATEALRETLADLEVSFPRHRAAFVTIRGACGMAERQFGPINGRVKMPSHLGDSSKEVVGMLLWCEERLTTIDASEGYPEKLAKMRAARIALMERIELSIKRAST